MQDTRPILIVGAGPTGMTAAMELSRFGIPVRIVDKLLKPSSTSRALAVQARTLELLEQRGVSAEMVKIGNQGRAATIYSSGKLLGKVRLSEIKSRYNYILLLSQGETERILREQLARQGVAVERGTELIAIAQSESGSELKFRYGVKTVLRAQDGTLEELDAAYVISAEGSHSSLRHTANLAFEGKSLGHSYALADLHLDGDIPDDELSIFLGEHGFMAVFPMGNRHFRFIATDPEKHGKDAGDPPLEELQKLYDADSHIPVRLRDMTWSSRFAINSRMTSTLRERCIFFGGDAAHIHSPAGGQGMNTGIQDMIDLSWKLAMVYKGQAAPELLDTYGEDRLPVIRGVVLRTEAATDAFNSDSAITHQLITYIAPVLLNRQFVQHLSTGMISEVDASYRESSISETKSSLGSLHAGDRVPDLDVVDLGTKLADGSPRSTRVYELLNPSLLTLFATGRETLENSMESLPQQLLPWHGILQTVSIGPSSDPSAREAFRKAFGTTPGLFLIRPDSYLGFVDGSTGTSSMLEWLKHWFPNPESHAAQT